MKAYELAKVEIGTVEWKSRNILGAEMSRLLRNLSNGGNP